MASDKKQTKSVGDWPTIKENQWYALAITSAIFTAVAICAAFAWIFGDGFDGDADLKKAQALAPFGVALFAVVTFCAASWRGSINTRQADQAEREGRAKLLQEGAKLLGQQDNPSHVSAGIATLEILAVGADERLAIQAMNLICDYLSREFKTNPQSENLREAISALKSGNSLNRLANRTIELKFQNQDDVFPEIYGVKNVVYKGGSVKFLNETRSKYNKGFRFSSCFVEFSSVVVDRRFEECAFQYSDILAIHKAYVVNPFNKHSFNDCDFSGCEFEKLWDMDLRSGGNYFSPMNKPKLLGSESAVDWTNYLNDHHPILLQKEALNAVTVNSPV